MPALGENPISALRARLAPVRDPGKPGPLGITEAELKAALLKNAAIYALAAQDLKCSRENVQQRVERSAELMAFCKEIEATVGDACKGGIYELITKKKDPATMRWYAERKLRHEGFSTKVDIVPPGGGVPGSSVKVTYEFVTPDARDDPPAAGENDEAPTV